MELTHEIRIFWPVSNLLSNPDLVIPICSRLGLGDWSLLYNGLYALLEHEIEESSAPLKDGTTVPESQEDIIEAFNWYSEEVCFSFFPEQNVIRITGESGIMIQLEEGGSAPFRIEKGSPHSGIRNSDEFQISSTLYQGFIEAIEKAKPELKGNIVLCAPPVPGNNYLRDEVTDNFVGQFHLMSDPEIKYDFSIEVNTDSKESVATVVESQGQ